MVGAGHAEWARFEGREFSSRRVVLGFLKFDQPVVPESKKKKRRPPFQFNLGLLHATSSPSIGSEGGKALSLIPCKKFKGLGQPAPKYWRVDSQTRFSPTFGSQFPKPVSGFGGWPTKKIKEKKRKTLEGLGVDAPKPRGSVIKKKQRPGGFLLATSECTLDGQENFSWAIRV
jgi:hypothetical protein